MNKLSLLDWFANPYKSRQIEPFWKDCIHEFRFAG
jgi:hypothetical protein